VNAVVLYNVALAVLGAQPCRWQNSQSSYTVVVSLLHSSSISCEKLKRKKTENAVIAERDVTVVDVTMHLL